MLVVRVNLLSHTPLQFVPEIGHACLKWFIKGKSLFASLCQSFTVCEENLADKLAQAARAVFNDMDADGSGSMDIDEVREALKILGIEKVSSRVILCMLIL